MVDAVPLCRRRWCRTYALSIYNKWLLDWVIGPLWCVAWVWALPRVVRLLPSPARSAPNAAASPLSTTHELGGASVRGVRGRGASPEEDAGQDQLVRDLLRRLHPRLPRRSSGSTASRSTAITTARLVRTSGTAAGPAWGISHTLFFGALVFAGIWAWKHNRGMDDRVPVGVRRACAHRRQRQHRDDPPVPVLDAELEPRTPGPTRPR